jgi:DMSO/TMAO reductase YedYZ heme-binding membrane subunit
MQNDTRATEAETDPDMGGDNPAADRSIRVLDEDPPKRGSGRTRNAASKRGSANGQKRPLSARIAGEHGRFKIMNLAIVLFCWWAVFQIQGPPPLWTVWAPAYVGLVYLALVLIPYNALRISLGGRQIAKSLANLVRWRRTLGLMAAAWFFLHFSAAVRYMRESYSVAELRAYYEPATNPGMTALLVFFVLFITSYDWARKLLGKSWKRLQSLVWYCVPLILVHSVGAKWTFEQSLTHVSLFILVGILGFAAYEFWTLSKRGDADRWRHPAMIAFGFLGALVVRFAPIN